MKNYKYQYLIESDSPSNPYLYCENDVNHLLFSCESDLVVCGNTGNKLKFVVWNGSLSSLSKQISSLGLSKDQIEDLIRDLTEVYEDTLESE